MRNTVTPRSVDAGMGMNDSAETNGSAKLSRGCGRSQKAGQRNAHLNGGQEVRRSLGDDEQTPRRACCRPRPGASSSVC